METSQDETLQEDNAVARKSIAASLQRLSKVGDYDQIHKLTSQFSALQQSQDEEKYRKWVQSHETNCKNLDLQHKAHRRLLKAWWDQKIIEHTAKVEEALKKLKVKHHREEDEIVAKATKLKLEQPVRFSSSIRKLRERELGLLQAQRYDDAQQVREMVNETASLERKALVASAASSVEKSLEAVRKRNEVSRLSLADQASLRWERLVSLRDQELEKLDTKFKRVSQAIQRAQNIKMIGIGGSDTQKCHGSRRGRPVSASSHLVKSACRERDIQHMLASGFVPSLLKKRGAGHQLSADRPEGLDLECNKETDTQLDGQIKARPSTAPTSRRRSLRSKGKKRGKPRYMQHKQRTKPAANKQKKCMFCGMEERKTRNRRTSNEFLAIPEQGLVQGGIGQFCSWECAKAWNHLRSPLQARWLRDLYIDEVAGTKVVPRSKQEMDKARVIELQHYEVVQETRRPASAPRLKRSVKYS